MRFKIILEEMRIQRIRRYLLHQSSMVVFHRATLRLKE